MIPATDTLATYSDYAFRSAVAIYLLAMALQVAEYAATRVLAGDRIPVRVGPGADPHPATRDQGWG